MANKVSDKKTKITAPQLKAVKKLLAQLNEAGLKTDEFSLKKPQDLQALLRLLGYDELYNQQVRKAHIENLILEAKIYAKGEAGEAAEEKTLLGEFDDV